MKVTNIGRAAIDGISRGGEARVIGVTSRGVFLAIDQRVLFVSSERWRGPLTINIDGPLNCAMGDSVRLSPTRLIFPAIEIDLSTAEVWRPAAPSFVRSMPEQQATLKQLVSSALARKAPGGFGLLLPHLLDLPEKQALSASDAALLARLTQLRESIHQQDFDQTTTLIESLLGLGRGLTPSGDDIAIGLLLSLNQWPLWSSSRGAHPERNVVESKDATKQSSANVLAFNQRVIDRAYQRTTTISANLIECAAHGEADERLINVVDGIVTGTPPIEDCVTGVLDWGNSSGMDALVGMTLIITAN